MSTILLNNFPGHLLNDTSPKETDVDYALEKLLDFFKRSPDWGWIQKCLPSIISHIGSASMSMEEGQVASMIYCNPPGYNTSLLNMLQDQGLLGNDGIPLITLLGYDILTKKFGKPLLFPCSDGKDLTAAFSLDADLDTLRSRAENGLTPFSPKRIIPDECNDNVVYATVVRCKFQDEPAFAFNLFQYSYSDPENTLNSYVGMFHYRQVMETLQQLDGVISIASSMSALEKPFSIPEGMSFQDYLNSLVVDDTTFQSLLSKVEETTHELTH